jgi:hypothetical protein
MNRKVLLVLVLVLASSIAGILAVRSFASPPPDLDQLRDAKYLKSALGLTDEQAASIQSLQEEYISELEECCGRHCQARAKLGEAMFADSGTDVLHATVESMCRAQIDSEMATITHIRKVHDSLTPDQQEKYERMVTGCVCGSCPAGFQHAK